jgi:hypothetical protein
MWRATHGNPETTQRTVDRDRARLGACSSFPLAVRYPRQVPGGESYWEGKTATRARVRGSFGARAAPIPLSRA